MSENGDYLGDLRANFALQFTRAVVRLLQRKSFVQFQMLLYVQAPVQILNTDVMNIQVVPRGYRADPVKYIFRRSRARYGVYDHISIGKDALNRVGNFFGNLARSLEGNATRQSN